MSYNASIDFLEMLKKDKKKSVLSGAKASSTASVRAGATAGSDMYTKVNRAANTEKNVKPNSKEKSVEGQIAVIDTETNWHDQVMSIGIAVADAVTFKCKDTRYFIIDPECRVGGIYSNVLHLNRIRRRDKYEYKYKYIF